MATWVATIRIRNVPDELSALAVDGLVESLCEFGNDSADVYGEPYGFLAGPAYREEAP